MGDPKWTIAHVNLQWYLQNRSRKSDPFSDCSITWPEIDLGDPKGTIAHVNLQWYLQNRSRKLDPSSDRAIILSTFHLVKIYLINQTLLLHEIIHRLNHLRVSESDLIQFPNQINDFENYLQWIQIQSSHVNTMKQRSKELRGSAACFLEPSIVMI